MERRRTLVPILLVSLVAWAIVFYLFMAVSPDSLLIISIWLSAFFIGMFFLALLVTHHPRRSLLLAFALLGYLLLRASFLDNTLNIILFFAIMVGLEFFFSM